ncbi:Lipoprotein-releasing system transmembrane protein LolE [Thalassocella blandensis]|nr:Lipoprotein-releasing system transmembrane protein LolE [Thalassocella blandensis]
MSKPLSFFIGFRYVGARRKSQSVAFLSRVSMLGLTVGVGLLILVLSVMNGFDKELRQRILGLVPQASIHHYQGIEDWQALKASLEADPEISAAAPFVQLNGLVSFRGNTSATMLYGFDPQAEQHVSLINENIAADVLQRLEQGEPLLLLGKGIAEALGATVGENIMVIIPNTHSTAGTPEIAYLELGGVVESKTELDASLALTSLQHAAKLAGEEGVVSGMRLKLKDLFAAPNVVYKVVSELGPGYYGNNWTRTHWNLYQAIHMSKNLVGLLMSLIVAIAAFNVVSTLVLVVVDKRGDIAILRTLGASTRQVMAIFIIQGCGIGVIGTLLGLFLGCGFSFVLQPVVSGIEALFNVQFLKSDVYPLTYLPSEIRLDDVVYVAGTAIGMSVLATLYPAWKASRVQPAEALRYE